MNGTIFEEGKETDIMKNLFLLFFVTFSTKPAFAECTMSGMQFLPHQKEISLNSRFIIQGYAYSEETINSFKNRIIYLESESGEVVELNLLEILTGQMSLTQAIFNSCEELKPNTIYFLKYSDQTESETRDMLQWNSEKKEMEKVFWKTTSTPMTEILNPDLKIQYENTEFVHYGCGPSANAIFNVKNKTESEIWYKTEVVDLSTNKKTIYYITAWNDKLNVGHDMCSGAFTFDIKGKYKVRFTPMNIDGKSLKTTDWITFDSPFLNDKSPFGI